MNRLQATNLLNAYGQMFHAYTEVENHQYSAEWDNLPKWVKDSYYSVFNTVGSLSECIVAMMVGDNGE